MPRPRQRRSLGTLQRAPARQVCRTCIRQRWRRAIPELRRSQQRMEATGATVGKSSPEVHPSSRHRRGPRQSQAAGELGAAQLQYRSAFGPAPPLSDMHCSPARAPGARLPLHGHTPVAIAEVSIAGASGPVRATPGGMHSAGSCGRRTACRPPQDDHSACTRASRRGLCSHAGNGSRSGRGGGHSRHGCGACWNGCSAGSIGHAFCSPMIGMAGSPGSRLASRGPTGRLPTRPPDAGRRTPR